ncbi:MAG: NDP-sugar synthase [Candidatus Eremiobacteraeota bacterium]|nr:NDP-sugar synthase [Candidatus Eremiobacteraeota bacterium]MBV8281323.1 NDP-sugar synthase [Candidatus Eremiobacteraeota bacterium]
MRGMVLAGGLSTRLYPLTLKLPKPLVPVLDRPVVAHVLDYVRRVGVDDIAINIHYFSDAVRGFIGDGSAWNARVTYLHETELMGSAGAVKQLAARFTETFVVIGCDDVTTLDLQAAVEFHRARRAMATIVLTRADDVSQYGVVVTDEDGRIRSFQEKPAPGTELSKLVNTGVYIFEPGVLEHIPANTFYDFGKQVFPHLLRSQERFFGMVQDAYWCDIGTPSEYRRVHRDALEGRVKLTPSEGAVARDGVLIGRDTSVAADATVIGPSCIGHGVIVEAGATVDRSIIWSGARIRAGARVTDAVIGNGVVVEPGASIRGGEHAAASAARGA